MCLLPLEPVRTPRRPPPAAIYQYEPFTFATGYEKSGLERLAKVAQSHLDTRNHGRPRPATFYGTTAPLFVRKRFLALYSTDLVQQRRIVRAASPRDGIEPRHAGIYQFHSHPRRTRVPFFRGDIPERPNFLRSQKPRLGAKRVCAGDPVKVTDVRVIPLSVVARQRHKIIRKRLALAAKQSVSGSPDAAAPVYSRGPTHAHLHHWQ